MLATVREAALADDVPGAILAGFHDVLGVDYATYDDLGPDGAVTLARPFHAGAVEAFGRHAHEHPALVDYWRTRRLAARRLSDLASQRQLRRLGLWAEVFRPLGIRHQIALGLHPAGRRLIGIGLSRTGRDFDDHELTVAELLRVELGRIVAVRAGPPPEALERAGLTRREAQVLALALRRTSREVAAALVISERTVEKHLEHAYEKLRVSSRREAAKVLAVSSAPSSRD